MKEGRKEEEKRREEKATEVSRGTIKKNIYKKSGVQGREGW
jgi:hypothetical protein